MAGSYTRTQVVLAEQVGETRPQLLRNLAWVLENGGVGNIIEGYRDQGPDMLDVVIQTKPTRLKATDWIILFPGGTFATMTHKVFNEQFNRTEGPYE